MPWPQEGCSCQKSVGFNGALLLAAARVHRKKAHQEVAVALSFTASSSVLKTKCTSLSTSHAASCRLQMRDVSAGDLADRFTKEHAASRAGVGDIAPFFLRH